jgi:hypothetical protein
VLARVPPSNSPMRSIVAAGMSAFEAKSGVSSAIDDDGMIKRSTSECQYCDEH